MVLYLLLLITLLVGHGMLRVGCQITADVDSPHSKNITRDDSPALPLRHKNDSKKVRQKPLRSRSTSRQLNSTAETHHRATADNVSDSTLGSHNTSDSHDDLDDNNTLTHWDEGHQNGILKMQNLRFQKILENTSG